MAEITCELCSPDLLPDIIVPKSISDITESRPFFYRRGGCYDLVAKIKETIEEYDNLGMEKFVCYMDAMMKLGEKSWLQVKFGKKVLQEWRSELYNKVKKRLRETKPEEFFEKYIQEKLESECGNEAFTTKLLPIEYDTYIFEHQSLCGNRYMTSHLGIPIVKNEELAYNIIDNLRKKAKDVYDANVLNPFGFTL